jgi:hypothetical protein
MANLNTRPMCRTHTIVYAGEDCIQHAGVASKVRWPDRADPAGLLTVVTTGRIFRLYIDPTSTGSVMNSDAEAWRNAIRSMSKSLVFGIPAKARLDFLLGMSMFVLLA